jgi:hypothetical protein
VPEPRTVTRALKWILDFDVLGRSHRPNPASLSDGATVTVVLPSHAVAFDAMGYVISTQCVVVRSETS